MGLNIATYCLERLLEPSDKEDIIITLKKGSSIARYEKGDFRWDLILPPNESNLMNCVVDLAAHEWCKQKEIERLKT